MVITQVYKNSHYIPLFWFPFCPLNRANEKHLHPDHNESEEETAKRELEEETGITKVKIISSVFFNEQYSFEKMDLI